MYRSHMILQDSWFSHIYILYQFLKKKKKFYLPGGSMKSKCTRSSIPSFFSCSTTEPRLDLRISGYVLSCTSCEVHGETKGMIQNELIRGLIISSCVDHHVNLNRDRESRAFEGLFNLFKKFPLSLSVT